MRNQFWDCDMYKGFFPEIFGKIRQKSGGFELGSPDLEGFLLVGRQIRAGLQKNSTVSPVLLPFNAKSFWRS